MQMCESHNMAKYWTGDIGPGDDFGLPIHDEFIDGVMKIGGKWATMSPESWKRLVSVSSAPATVRGTRSKPTVVGSRWRVRLWLEQRNTRSM